jgi:aspartate kinase
MSELMVGKFGGTSVGNKDFLSQLEKIRADDPRRKVFCYSAPNGAIKVTNTLMDLAQTKDLRLISPIMDMYRHLGTEKDREDLAYELIARLDSGLEGASYLDSIKAFGEYAAARLIAKSLGHTYVDPRDIMLMSSEFGNAKILDESEDMIRRSLGDPDVTYAVPGFFGYSKDGQIVTLSRGGSDLSGAYLAKSLDAILYENFSDKDGVGRADPRIIPDAKKIQVLTYHELRDLSYSGFSIFHPAAMGPLMDKDIPIHVRNTFSYPEPGTVVQRDRASDADMPIVGVAYRNGFCTFNIDCFGINEEVGIGERILKAFADEKISYEFMPGVIDDISIVFRQDQLIDGCQLARIRTRLLSEVGEKAQVEFTDSIGCMVVAGKGLRGRKGIAGEIQQMLANYGINLRFIVQGAKERCIGYGLDQSDGHKAVKVIYDAYLSR